ncbi:MAG: tRNA glutamyl-Q(34) synthetase GluQRS [Filomicrobium sp.]
MKRAQLKPVFRFAPSPNGFLHLGHAASALINSALARRYGSRLLLRIEDIDKGRTREAFVDAIFEDLEWLGLTWEQPVLRQSRRLETYAAAAKRLADLGFLYPCFASRAEINEAAVRCQTGLDLDGAPIYPGLHRDLSAVDIERRISAGEPFAMRLNMERAVKWVRERTEGEISYQEFDGEDGRQTVSVDPMRWGDVVLQRKDVPTSYHLSVVVDDADQEVTHVVRGLDLQPATAIHRLLQELLGFAAPVYHHHALIRDALGNKLSKSDAATSLRSLREAGWSPADVIGRLGLEGLSG